MNAQELIEAWAEAQSHDTYTFYERFFQLTGLEEEEVKRLFGDWNRTHPERVEEIARKHGVTVREGGFQAFLAERFWPEDKEAQTLIVAARYLRYGGREVQDNIRQGRIEGARVLEHILDCRTRLGRFPVDYILFDSEIEGPGDPREGRGDWPPEEDCPYCPTGRKDDLDSPHKMSCSWAKGQSGRMTIPLKVTP